MTAGLDALRFDDSYVRALPADDRSGGEPREVPGACYTRVEPTAVRAPRLLAWSDAAGALLGASRPSTPDGPEAAVLGGNRVLPGMQPYAARYGGHQFGRWAGQLGDGRAITLAEVLGPGGRRWDLQLKGAGRTPYSRFSDGRAVLRSSLREFLCSEAMHHLGVPTTRALSLVGTGEAVTRDMFYDGRPRDEPGAVVCRVAPSFVRFGNFEIHAALGELEALKRLADYVIATHFPELGPSAYAAWFEEVARRTGALAADWMRVGFVHGVLNTDNMSILGLTIDYGPYGWLEGFDPAWTPNTTDAVGRRYAYGNQPSIAIWNLARLGEALAPLIPDRAALERGLDAFRDAYERAAGRSLAAKLGLEALDQPGDDVLVDDLFGLLQAVETDMTLFFRGLARVPAGEVDDLALTAPLRPAYYAEETLAGEQLARVAAWLRRWIARGGGRDVERMRLANPKYVPRNYLAQQAIDALERGDASVLERLMQVLQRPYDEQPEHEELAARRPEWARRKAGCSALSCSS